MIDIDLHVHSLFSHCGLHTILELIEQARKLGMKGLAITDHGMTLGGRLNSVFFDRFICPYHDFHLFKGIECNILDDQGSIDLPEKLLPFMDIILLGVHHNTPKGLTKEYYTNILLSAINKNQIDIITHPNDSIYPLDYPVIVREASKRGIAIELNNSRILYSRGTIEDTMFLLECCKQEKCRVAICSDTHSIHELGQDNSVQPLLNQSNFPHDLLITNSATATLQFISERKALRKNQSSL